MLTSNGRKNTPAEDADYAEKCLDILSEARFSVQKLRSVDSGGGEALERVDSENVASGGRIVATGFGAIQDEETR